jgi:hypothetical protein
MNTAQVSIELVLAGILGLCAFVLPFFPGADFNTNLLQNEALIGVLGLAYLLGVIFDKLADTILHPMEHILRLRQADEYLSDHPGFEGEDPYPQNKLEFNLRKSKDGRLDWMNSLKSRIRTSRELAVLSLPAAMGIVIHLSAVPQWIYVPVALNLLAFILAVFLESVTADEDEKTTRWRIKRRKTHHLSRDASARKDELRNALGQARKVSIPYYLLIAVPVCTIGVTALRNPENTQIPLIGAGGLILSMLALWTCLTITVTYIRFVAREMPGYLKEKGE